MSTTTSYTTPDKKYYTKELVCMNCGHIHTYEVPMGVEWEKHIKVCENCGCCRFSDYYKNIDNFRPVPKYDGPWLNSERLDRAFETIDLLDQLEKHGYERNHLDCRGIDVTPPKYNPVDQLTTMFDSIPKTNLQDVINKGGQYGK